MPVSSTLASAAKGPAQILYGPEASITAAQALYQRAKIDPTGVAFVFGNSAKTYEWLADKTARLACGFIARSLKRGDRILLHLPNRAEFVIASYACFHIGAVAVPLKIRLTTEELRLLLGQLRPALYIGDTDFYDAVDSIGYSVLPPGRRIVVGYKSENNAQPWVNLLNDIESAPPAVAADVDDPAVLLATMDASGGTNCAILTHADFVALRGLPYLCGAVDDFRESYTVSSAESAFSRTERTRAGSDDFAIEGSK
jgi:acyl-CoA synthetase (AMP-forming)/AMP-acid ligase II